MALRKQYDTLAAAILLGIFIIMLLIFGWHINEVVRGIDTTCRTSVEMRAKAIQLGGFTGSVNPPLVGCDTKIRHFTDESDKKLTQQIIRDYEWCFASFYLQDEPLIREDDNVLCHVCALYTRENTEPVAGLPEQWNTKTQQLLAQQDYTQELVNTDMEPVTQVGDAELTFDEPYAIIFYQVRGTQEFRDRVLRDVVVPSVGGYAGGATARTLFANRLIAKLGARLVGKAVVSVMSGGTITAGILVGEVTFFMISRLIPEQVDVENHIVFKPMTRTTAESIGCSVVVSTS